MKRRTVLSTLAFAALAPVAGCGFQLRGRARASVLPFQRVHVSGGGATGLAADLRRTILADSGTEVVDDPNAAQAIIEILSELRDRSTVTLNTQGRIREYSLSYRVRFRVRDATGRELLAPTDITLRRDLSYNESQAIAKEREEDMLFRDMQADAVQQVLRRIAALNYQG